MSGGYIDASSVIFSLYSSEDVRKLSVLQITNPNSFNLLGHPLQGSLYDPALGPVHEKAGPCATCLRNVFNCPGHFGYIELPLPVVNPLFSKMIYQILRMSCLSCHALQIQGSVRYTLIAQLRLLDAGFITECQELETQLSMGLDTKESTSGVSHDVMVKEKIENYVENVLSGEKKVGSKKSKNVEAIRNSYLQAVATNVKSNKCISCQAPIRRIIYIHRRFMTTVQKVDVAPKFVAKGELADVRERGKSNIVMMMPDECRTHLREIWVEGQDFITAVIPALKDSALLHPTDNLFIDVVPVPPPKTRPVNIVDGRKVEHPQSQSYKRILQDCVILKYIIKLKLSGNTNDLPEDGKALVQELEGNTDSEKLHNAWKTLQQHVDELVDSDLARSTEKNLIGLKQIIEKKEGIIRMHMMGKRVNFAARSVITPDPNLDVDEIGVPERFAMTLTYPVPVTAWNANHLRMLITRGPAVHPGAVSVEHEDGSISRISAQDAAQRENIAKRLLTPVEKSGSFKGVKYVHRHLHNGDILLMNRQPTLHRPSIMAHKARVLKREKTFRLHYSNCKAYNADFDGDEMNAHFPQNELARSEAYNLASVPHQYLVPKDGSPLAGLIQDHIIAGVKLSLRGRFFTREDYCQMVYQAFPRIASEIKLLPPAIIKPIPLWSGKQIFSTIIMNSTPKGRPSIYLESTAKIGAKAWQSVKPRRWKAGGTEFTNPVVMSESEVVIHNGELLSGVLDKTHYGASRYGLVHCVYELYGGVCASKLLSSFTKLFTSFMQREGFTLGIEDILVVEDADRQRTAIIQECRKVGLKAVAAALNITDEEPDKEEVKEKLLKVYGDRNAKWRTLIDRAYKRQLDNFTNNINGACLPSGLLQKFPMNNLQLMVQSGAKGSTVNTMQISCLLGQIELEGKRPPLMVSGKALPSFLPFDMSPRAGGFIDGRFMTGIQPQEFFFHCMAGREGLIDTAVKTSRSGYLQRCVIKHLEGLMVHYDLTVRDSDKSVIQFYYGEDGMDIMKAQFLNEKQIGFLAQNSKAVMNKPVLQKWKELENETPTKLVEEAKKNIPKWVYRAAKSATKTEWREINKVCPRTITSQYRPDEALGALTERMESLILHYLDNRPSCSHRQIKKKEIKNMIYLKSMEALCPPGEPVGVIAAQSIGEPSTQMTLNTFHFAGRGEMNVTLGIPRLREILMMASKNIHTPSMEIPFRTGLKNVEAKAEKLRRLLKRTTLADVLQYISVKDCLDISRARRRIYTLKFQFLPYSAYKAETIIKPHDILQYFEKTFISNLFNAIRKAAKYTGKLLGVQTGTRGGGKDKAGAEDEEQPEVDEDAQRMANIAKRSAVGEEHESSDEEPEGDDDDATMARSRGRRNENQDYDEPEEEEEAFIREDSEDEGIDNEGAEEDAVDGANEEEADDDQVKESKTTPNFKIDSASIEQRRASVIGANNFVMDYTFDTVHESWCELKFGIPLSIKRVNLSNILKTEAPKAVVWEVPNIKRAFTFVAPDTQRLILKTDGMNIEGIAKYDNILDLNHLYSNDIYQVSQKYGIEAARIIIVKEVKDVFKMYGIDVDSRHLLLVADYMTFDGTFKPLSRRGMEDSCSPLQQMSFESSLNFIRHAALQGKRDELESPSSRIMVGRPCRSGTGAFSLLHKLDIPEDFTL
ncbi:DNA-directed RNA polymerase I subunit RPA1 [Schistocerca americana]|uniref:DNA-directed RNA polymerase I subunit RPA1 n=1 Tax=Schistocerca americana TaxID=7009 RepID=UPI001F5030AC|nr:DNA-directed RNA polymerase I subunit RPA1 [Schistocerca americana]XP_046999768.1 DNA-directed RNA polymerase I subunit RPA1 [Schistocerca americana]